jgi:tRNA-specific 2-thiouridylase
MKKACHEQNRRVFVAMSGGVDSSLAAALLKEQGYDVRGIFMRTWSPEGIHCTTRDDRFMAARAAAHLGIPFAVWDFRDEYKNAVVDYMTAEYAVGRTPNPDVMCNSRIKFGVFLQKALEQGADFIATGHYVKIKNKKSKIKMYELACARDLNKDQSYFLWTLTQDQLKHCLFPIGDYEKSQVRRMAQERGLPNWDKKDSQGLCFVGAIDFADFLRSIMPAREGAVLTTTGATIGMHDGAQFVTIGQRHGLNLGIKNHELTISGNRETKAHYVVERDMATNTVVVAEENDPALYRKEIIVTDVNWIPGETPQMPLSCFARIRFRQHLQEARIMNHESWGDREKSESIIHDSRFVIQFKNPQRAVAPGQSAVCYAKNGAMLGGGVIA